MLTNVCDLRIKRKVCLACDVIDLTQDSDVIDLTQDEEVDSDNGESLTPWEVNFEYLRELVGNNEEEGTYRDDGEIIDLTEESGEGNFISKNYIW